MKWFAVCATTEIMHQLVSSKPRIDLRFRRLGRPDVVVTMNPSLRHLILKSTDFTCLLVWNLSAVLLSLLSSRLTSLSLIQSCFLSWRVFSSKEKCNFTLIKIPLPPSFIPSENDISQMSIRPCFAGLLLRTTRRQNSSETFWSAACYLAREALKGYTSVSCCQLPVAISNTVGQKTLWAERRCEKTQLSSRVYGLKWVNVQGRKGFIRTP